MGGVDLTWWEGGAGPLRQRRRGPTDSTVYKWAAGESALWFIHSIDAAALELTGKRIAGDDIVLHEVSYVGMKTVKRTPCTLAEAMDKAERTESRRDAARKRRSECTAA